MLAFALLRRSPHLRPVAAERSLASPRLRLNLKSKVTHLDRLCALHRALRHHGFVTLVRIVFINSARAAPDSQQPEPAKATAFTEAFASPVGAVGIARRNLVVSGK